MEKSSSYHEPLALIIISAISLGIAAIAATWIAIDIIIRKGWKSMMLIMIPVYVINATYIWPITLGVYLLYGRPTKGATAPSCHTSTQTSSGGGGREQEAKRCRNTEPSHRSQGVPGGQDDRESHQLYQHENREVYENHQDHEGHQDHGSDVGSGGQQHVGERPMFATVTVAVCHCGAGCVLGDIVGEWLVYGTGAMIRGEQLWVNYLVDFAFAISFGIVFQYFSIAPMSGDYGVKTIIRAAKADFLSLLFFEIGLFSWMAIFQIAIFHWQLPMTTVTYWWMMQIGMFCGHWTGMPINWWLIKKGVKEPCA